MVTVPTIWDADRDEHRLAHIGVNIDDDCKRVSFAATDVISVLCHTRLELPTMVQCRHQKQTLGR